MDLQIHPFKEMNEQILFVLVAIILTFLLHNVQNTK